MGARLAWRKGGRVTALAVAAGLVATLLVAGCGQGPVSAGTTAPTTAASTSAVTARTSTTTAVTIVPPSETTASSSAGTTAIASASSLTVPPSTDSGPLTTRQDIDQLFAELGAAVRPMTIFGPSLLPKNTTIAASWWPVIESADPSAYQGPPVGNPRVVGTGGDAEIQVILQTGKGWLAILENFRGDLGDVTGIPVGSVAGNPAALYRVNGGELVQWGRDGRWYGVFGRGIGSDDIVAVALRMRPTSAEGH